MAPLPSGVAIHAAPHPSVLSVSTEYPFTALPPGQAHFAEEWGTAQSGAQRTATPGAKVSGDAQMTFEMEAASERRALFDRIMLRIDEGSGNYQMSATLCDAVIFSNEPSAGTVLVLPKHAPRDVTRLSLVVDGPRLEHQHERKRGSHKPADMHGRACSQHAQLARERPQKQK